MVDFGLRTYRKSEAGRAELQEGAGDR
ncbi:hypothetical protein MESS2_70007 [Mesorhizobium metallidurans STM 2683]|uniref:Uncharacterized protein n=1 Tax=Mesorhizobium metallidurans STM 2683 TaxID=1297569 RepID=M5EVJ9_9HYPH|nr:hypothetical protein MESS2_70007 [Mesorhizobium metallidurans STM 2683]